MWATAIVSACGGKTSVADFDSMTAGTGGAAAGAVGGSGTVPVGGSPIPVGGTGPVAGGGGPIPVGGSVGYWGGAAGFAGSGGVGGSGGTPDAIVEVRPTTGCELGFFPDDLIPGQFIQRTIYTSGVKDADATGNPGPWAYQREYFVRLPANYDNRKPYPLVFQGPGCGGDGEAVYPLPDIADQVIKVGMTPPPADINHGTFPGGGCFDEHEGDDSVEFPFYESVWNLLGLQLCFDQNRVFIAGNATGGGAWANEVACKYAGDPTHPIRAVAANAGEFPTEPQYRPTCSSSPLAGIWIHEVNDSTRPFEGAKEAIKRAMSVNGCTVGTSYDDATLENYPIGGGNPDDTCKKIFGCPELYPLVVCPLPGNGHGSHDGVANPGLATFFSSFFAP